MTQMPPPNRPAGYPAPGAIPQSTSNPMAIVSLICGLIGCLVITPIIGIITGLIGFSKAKAPVGGKGMAIAGIILSLLWIVGGVGVGATVYFGAKKLYATVQTNAVPPTITLINQIESGDLAGAEKASNLSSSEIAQLAEKIKLLGKCTAITVSVPAYRYENGTTHYVLVGPGTFERGSSMVIGELTDVGSGAKVDKLELQK